MLLHRMAVCSAVVGALLGCPAARAETNRASVQADIQKGWDTTVFGKELDHKEYAKIGVAVGSSVASGTPAPLVDYLKYFTEESLRQLTTELKRELIVEALRNPGKVFRSGQWEVSGGFATYQHWEVVKIEVPNGVEIKGVEVTVRTKTETRKLQLPNTYQPYVRLRKKTAFSGIRVTLTSRGSMLSPSRLVPGPGASLLPRVSNTTEQFLAGRDSSRSAGSVRQRAGDASSPSSGARTRPMALISSGCNNRARTGPRSHPGPRAPCA